MAVKIGWSLDRPGARKPGRIAGGVYLFELLKVDEDGRGKHVVVGTLGYHRDDLERLREKRHVVDVRVVGRLRFAPDVTPALLDATIGRIRVTGSLSMSPALAEAIARHRA
jgi:hypothetical protein